MKKRIFVSMIMVIIFFVGSACASSGFNDSKNSESYYSSVSNDDNSSSESVSDENDESRSESVIESENENDSEGDRESGNESESEADEDIEPTDAKWFKFTLLEDDSGYSVAKCEDYDENTYPTEIVIPQTYNNKPVTVIEEAAFIGCKSITRIKMPDSVATIEDNAFHSCNRLESVVIPKGVVSIGRLVYYECNSIEKIEVALENAGYYSINNCLIEKSTETLILGCKNSIIPSDGSVKTIGEWAFGCCDGLINIKIPDKNMPSGLVAKIKNKVEAGATSLTIAISGTPQSVETVRAYIEIPEQYLVTGEYDITIDPNKNKVDFSIVSGETIDVPVPSDTQFVYDGEAKVLMTDGEGYTVSNNKNTFAGEYTAVVTLKKGYKWSDGTTDPKNIAWTIKRQDVTIEVTLTKTTYECTGYTIEPEYTVYRITSTGNVELPRSEYKGELTKNKDVGTATLTVKDNGIGNYNITNPVVVNFEIIKGTKTPPTGLTGIAPSADGAKDGKITGTTADMEYSTDTEFTSPKPCTDTETTGLAEGTYYVRYKATPTTKASAYAEVKVALNSVTVVGGTGGGKYAAGTSVTVKVTVPTGKTFASWTFSGVVLSTAQLTQEEITFTMPETDVVLTALFKDITYNVTVTNGTASAPKAKYQEEVTVTANAPEAGKAFDKWVVTGITLSDEDLAKATLTFKMPAGYVTMEATYKDVVYQVTVQDGTASAPTATYQTEVTVKANEPTTDMYFDKWEVTGLDTTDMDLTKTEIKFQMPAENVTFKATYRAIEKFAIEMVDGTKDKEVAKAGETVTITANPAPTGKVFDKWTCETAGVTIEFKNATSSKTTFVMPASNIKIQAHFRAVDDKPSVEIKVEGGTGGGTYKQGDEVTVTAEDKEGKEFVGWKDESGKIVSTDKSYKFTVTEATTLTAVYDDMPSGGGEITPPAKKDGLSGGQIAGIVIGSVLLAGIGGFAVLWFAVKKKTFADLGVALKKVFTAIGNFFKTLGAKIKSLFTKKK